MHLLQINANLSKLASLALTDQADFVLIKESWVNGEGVFAK